MIQEGDIVEIPLPDGRIAIGRILHLSKHFKDAVGFIVFGIKGDVRNDVVVDHSTGDPKAITVLGPLYTNLRAAQHYGWKSIEQIPMQEQDRLLTKREVGGGVYVGDEYLGSVDELGEYDLRPMLLHGMLAVYDAIEKGFGKAASPDSFEQRP
jgi:hypothetical protein